MNFKDVKEKGMRRKSKKIFPLASSHEGAGKQTALFFYLKNEATLGQSPQGIRARKDL